VLLCTTEENTFWLSLLRTKMGKFHYYIKVSVPLNLESHIGPTKRLSARQLCCVTVCLVSGNWNLAAGRQ